MGEYILTSVTFAQSITRWKAWGNICLELVQIAADNNRDEDSFNSFNKIAILKIKVQMKDL